MDSKEPSKTLPFTLLACCGVVILILISSAVSSGQFSMGPAAIILFVATFFVVKERLFKKK